MHNLKFSSKLISLISLSYKQNRLWFDIIITNSIKTLVYIFNSVGIISNFFVVLVNNKKLFRVFVRYTNLEIPIALPLTFYFKPSHKLPISIKTLRRLCNELGSSVAIIPTSRGLMTSSDCISIGIGGILHMIIYI